MFSHVRARRTSTRDKDEVRLAEHPPHAFSVKLSWFQWFQCKARFGAMWLVVRLCGGDATRSYRPIGGVVCAAVGRRRARPRHHRQNASKRPCRRVRVSSDTFRPANTKSSREAFVSFRVVVREWLRRSDVFAFRAKRVQTTCKLINVLIHEI